MLNPTDKQLKDTNRRIKAFIDGLDGDEIFSNKISVVALREDILADIPSNLQSNQYCKVLMQTYPANKVTAEKVVKMFQKQFKVVRHKITEQKYEYQDNLVIYIFPK